MHNLLSLWIHQRYRRNVSQSGRAFPIYQLVGANPLFPFACFIKSVAEVRREVYSYLLVRHTRHWVHDHPEWLDYTTHNPLQIGSSGMRAVPLRSTAGRLKQITMQMSLYIQRYFPHVVRYAKRRHVFFTARMISLLSRHRLIFF